MTNGIKGLYNIKWVKKFMVESASGFIRLRYFNSLTLAIIIMMEILENIGNIRKIQRNNVAYYRNYENDDSEK
jgi:hypothetical protein